jgi:hypothetical protein
VVYAGGAWKTGVTWLFRTDVSGSPKWRRLGSNPGREVLWGAAGGFPARAIPGAVSCFQPGWRLVDAWELFSPYSRAGALGDSGLSDVSTAALEAGIRFPVALTAAPWHECVAVPPGVAYQDEAGRLWDVAWLLRCAIALSVAGQRSGSASTSAGATAPAPAPGSAPGRVPAGRPGRAGRHSPAARRGLTLPGLVPTDRPRWGARKRHFRRYRATFSAVTTRHRLLPDRFRPLVNCRHEAGGQRTAHGWHARRARRDGISVGCHRLTLPSPAGASAGPRPCGRRPGRR